MGKFFKALQDIADQVIDEYEKDILIPAIDMTIKDIQELLNQEVGKLIQDYYKKSNFSPTTYIRSNQLKTFQPLVMITPIYKTSDDYSVSFDADIEDQYTGEDLSQRMDHSSYQIRVKWKTKNGIKSKIYTVHRSAKAQETLSNQDLERLIAGNQEYEISPQADRFRMSSFRTEQSVR